ncbi:MAG: S16 family serine protease [Candidatus Planktophila sp.]
MRYSSLPIAVKSIIILFFGLALFAPLPFVVVMPGGATDVLDKVISIKSEHSYKPTGSLYLLAVRVTSPGSAMFSGEIVYGWANGDQRVFPRSVLYPDHVSAQVIDKEAKVDMTSSQDKAKIVALAYMKKNYPQLPSVDPSLITLDVKETGGPSGGMVFTLGVIEELTPQDLLQGRKVAGTGTIDLAGKVGPIGGIDEKLIAARRAGATLFLAPRANCAEITSVPEGITLYAIRTIDDAVNALSANSSPEKLGMVCTNKA